MLAPAYIDSGGIWVDGFLCLAVHFLSGLLKLHFRLLNNSFQLTNEIRIAPHSAAARDSLVAESASVIQRSQKVPTEMMRCPTRQSLAPTYPSGRYRAVEAFRGRVLI